jgi:PAS domain S-box-containing protein
MIENTFGINIIPENDDQRIAALKRYQILDTPPENSFDHVARLATQIFGVPISLVSLVDAEQVYFKANVGMGTAKGSPRGMSLCSLAVMQPDVTVFENAAEESCLLANPNVAGSFGLKFYAGAPITTHDGFLIGTLCVIDKTPRTFSLSDREILKSLAKIVMDEIELRLSAIREVEKQQEYIEEAAAINEELLTANEELLQTQLDLKDSFDALSLSEAKAKYMIADAPVAIGVLSGQDLIIESANDKLLELWGKTIEVIDQPLDVALPELEGQAFLGILAGVLHTNMPFYGNELKVNLVRNGSMEEVYFNFVYHPLKDFSGHAASIMIVATEVTDQVLARIQINSAEERLRLAINAASMGSWYIDPETKSLEYNAQLARIFGYEGNESMTYEQALAQVTAEYRPIITFAINKAIASGEDYDVTYTQHRFNDDAVIWLRSIGKITRDDKGEFTIFSGVVMDITQQKEDDQRKNDFISMVSHELKTPLTSMNGYIQMLTAKAKKGDDVFAVNVLEKANKQTRKMTVMINDFLNMKRLESGKISLNRQEFDMAKLVIETEEETIATISSHQVIFAPVETTVLMADHDKIGQVINNLISNAVKYSPAGSTINVACITINNTAQLSVKDQGMGIAAADQARLFDRFYRVESKEMETINGFGIGLYLCDEIIRMHQGKLWVESELGKGSTFYFSIPI